MQRNKELRKAPAGYLDAIAEILEIDDDWKRFMSLIPKDLQNDNFEPKYNSEHIGLIEKHAQNTKSKCAKVLFDEWGTSGRVRPTIQTLMDILKKAEMIRAADQLASQLNENPPPRPMNGPAAHVDTSVTSILYNESMEQKLNSMESIKSENFSTGINGTYRNLCNDPTKQMKSVSDLIKFSTYNIPDFDAIAAPSTGHIKKEASDLIKFSSSQTSSQYIPAFDVLNPKTVELNSNTNSTLSVVSTDSESSQTASDITAPSDHDNTQYSQIVPLPSGILYEQVDIDILQDVNLIKFKYGELEAMTNNFSNTNIGSGGFGEVYVGAHEKYGKLAVKKAHNFQFNQDSYVVRMFNSEVKSLSILRHNNIVPILGYSIDGVAPCIICEYVDGGSLLQNIAAKVLNECQRMNIIIGTAEGLKYIHNSVKPSSLSESQPSSKKAYFLHGDVKSANILLTKDCVPKLCDFGLSKQYDTTFITKSIMGTSAYMAPERFSGTITQKGDVFSYGIVLLELLTGLEPIVTDNTEIINIKTYVEENCTDDDITSILDPLIGKWSKAQKIYELAKLCLIMEKNRRPSMDAICNTLHKINDSEH